MIATILQWFATSKIGRWIAIAGAVILAYLSVRSKHREEGRQEVRTEAVEKSLGAVRHAQEVDRAVRGSDPYVELRRWTRPDS